MRRILSQAPRHDARDLKRQTRPDLIETRGLGVENRGPRLCDRLTPERVFFAEQLIQNCPQRELI